MARQKNKSLSATLAFTAALYTAMIAPLSPSQVLPNSASAATHNSYVENEGIKAGVIFTGETERLRAGIELYLNGTIDHLLISGFTIQWNAQRLIDRLGITVPEGRALNGIVFERDLSMSVATNTQENAINTALWAQRLGAHSMTLITADYHMDRSRYNIGMATQSEGYHLHVQPHPVTVNISTTQWIREQGKAFLTLTGFSGISGQQTSF